MESIKDSELKRLESIISNAKNIVFFTGAGVSTECGIPDFRGFSGLYNQSNTNTVKPEEVLTEGFFLSHTDEFYKFYANNLVYPDAMPGSVHRFISALEKTGKNITVITQNIDGLHQKAGSTNVIELHGSIEFNTCIKCRKKYSLAEVMSNEFDDNRGVPTCVCGSPIKPGITLYNEPVDPQVLSKAIEAVQNADAIVVLGTTLAVSPACMLLECFKGEYIVIINKGPTEMDRAADLRMDTDVSVLSKIQLTKF